MPGLKLIRNSKRGPGIVWSQAAAKLWPRYLKDGTYRFKQERLILFNMDA